jgi:hypothetical protein
MGYGSALHSEGGRMKAQVLVVVAAVCCLGVTACSVQRAMVAQDAQGKLVGLTKEQVLACMGPPATRMAEGATEVWSYNSGDGRTTTVATANAVTDVNGTATRFGNTTDLSGTATSSGFGTAVTRRRACTVNVTIVDGRVNRVNYLGPTGGLLTQGEQCAYAVQACVQ